MDFELQTNSTIEIDKFLDDFEPGVIWDNIFLQNFDIPGLKKIILTESLHPFFQYIKGPLRVGIDL